MEKRFINFNDQELETLNKIIIRCSAKFQSFLDKQSVFEISINNSLQDMPQKDKIQFDIFSILLTLDPTEIFPPSYFKKKIDDHLKKEQISEETELYSKTKLMNNTSLSKIFDTFIQKGMIKNIRDKKEINQYRHKIKRKKGFKTGGRISYYKTSEEFEQIKKVLVKPEAVKFLTDSFNQTPLLSDFLKAWFKYTINNLKKTKDSANLRSTVSFFIQSHDEKSIVNNWESFIELISSIDDITLNLILEELSNLLRKNQKIMQIIYLLCSSNFL